MLALAGPDRSAPLERARGKLVYCFAKSAVSDSMRPLRIALGHAMPLIALFGLSDVRGRDKRDERFAQRAHRRQDQLHQIRVLLVDEHEFFRTGLRNVLAENGLHVVGESMREKEALEMTWKRAPDVVVVDPVTLAGGRMQIGNLTANCPVLVVTDSTKESDAINALSAGASGYLLKHSSIEDVLAGVRATATGGAPISPEIAAKLLPHLNVLHEAASADAVLSELSERELQVLRLLAQGMGNARIAAQLEISGKTVQHHVARILEKLQVENRIQAAVYAARSGIV
jgi:DNA-binding NarL/FixJ family response regulator